MPKLVSPFCRVLVFVFTTLTLVAADPFQGDWRGEFATPTKSYRFKDKPCEAQVIALGSDTYRVQLFTMIEQRAPAFFVAEGKLHDGVLHFESSEARGTISDDVLRGEVRNGLGETIAFALRPWARRSPTEGRPPEPGAVVIFDGKTTDGLRAHASDGPPVCELRDGFIELTPGKGKLRNNLASRATFSDVFLHIEFLLPLEPSNRGQARANSGVFLQDTYEIQVLDSYGLGGLWDECGALYQLSAPKINMCYPPLSWQTYDIIYRAPRFKADGTLGEPARFTVFHNGQLIHHDQAIRAELPGGKDAPPRAPAPIRLQDHSNPVRYRNIWALDLSDGSPPPAYLEKLAR